MTEGSSDLLSRAADLIRDVAEMATDGPWECDAQSVWHAEDKGTIAGPGGCGEGGFTSPFDADWVVLLNPAVAPHLEAWLRATVKHVAMFGASADCAGCRPALAFARAILGEEESK